MWSGTSEEAEGNSGGRQGGRERAAPSVSPIRTARIAVFLEPDEWTRTPDSHRVNRFCRPTVRRLCLVRDMKMGRPTGFAPARRLSQSRMLLLHHGLHFGSSGRRCPGMVRITSAVHCLPLPRRNEMALPRGLAPRTSAFAGRHAGFSYTSGAKKFTFEPRRTP